MPRLSFRDPDGFVFRSRERIFRCVLPHAVPNLREFLPSGIATAWMEECVLASTAVVPDGSVSELRDVFRDAAYDGSVILEHGPIPFPNYPYEWPPGMLHAAGRLTLRMARESLDAGFGLKDATPYNVMFDGPRPVFLDVLSFERRDPLDVLWRPYGQFVRSFVYPLLAARYCGVRVDELLLVHRDGIEPERMLRLCPAWRRWFPPFLGAVSIPVLVSRDEQASGFSGRSAKDRGEARFVMERRLQAAGRLLGKMPPRDGASRYRDGAARYMQTQCVYSDAEWAAKERAVAEALDRYRPRKVLDIGCNAGYFSRLAARGGARVVAIDHDPEVVGAAWRMADAEGLAILPLVVNIARPTGGCGWSNDEFASFLDRARGQFDCVLMLALIHHLLVNERVPLDRIFDLAASLTSGLLVVEFVDPGDPQFRTIARGRDALHRDLTVDTFKNAAGRCFEIAEERPVTSTRRIYTLERRRN